MSDPNQIQDNAPAAEYDYSAIYKSPAGISVHREWYEKKLHSLNLPNYERLTVKTRFGPTHLLALGPLTAPPLVFIHSSLESALEWEHQLWYFAQIQTHRVYFLDIIGHSAPSVPVRLSNTNSDYAIWLLEVLYGLNLKRADFVGLGFGGGVVIKLAGLTPSRINSLVWINPVGLAGLRTFSLPGLFITLLLSYPFPKPPIIRRILKYHCAPQTRLEENTMQSVIECFQMARKYFKWDNANFNFSDEELNKLTAPGLILLGQQNRVRKMGEIITRARRVLPRLNLEMVPNAGNALELEQPDYLNHAITNFLRYVAAYYGAPAPAQPNPALGPVALG
jgi:pimeloyl-ACP methyl ester carboxylesterase